MPAHIDACRCGKPRPADIGASGAAEWAQQQAAAQVASQAAEWSGGGLFGTKSLLQFGGLLLVFGLFFGSRYFNRYRASREVRAVVIAQLSKDLGAEAATGLADKVHWTCFEPNYHMSFRRRGGTPTFDDKEYASCVRRALEREVGQMRSVGPR